ncbi:MAG: YceD family protein [Actinomycetota bacterium]
MTSKGLNALREASQLSVDISEILRDPGTSKRVQITEDLEGLSLDMGRADRALELDLVLESLVEGVLVRGMVRGAYQLECIRCLRSFERPLAVELSEVITYPDQPEAEEGYQVVGDHADLEPVVRDAVLLAMPVNPLHAPDCKGLCAVCGTDRNETDCGHEGRRVDLRWEPLEQLKDRLRSSGSPSREQRAN